MLAGGVAPLLGMIGIVSVTTASVLERVYEIGLRRALGATRRNIAAQFLAESAILGTLGGIAGTCIAVIALVVTAATRHWVAVFTPAPLLPDPLIGTVAGLLAGIYPSARAAIMSPIQAPRRQ